MRDTNNKGESTVHPEKCQLDLRNCCNQLNTRTLDNLEEMDHSSENTGYALTMKQVTEIALNPHARSKTKHFRSNREKD